MCAEENKVSKCNRSWLVTKGQPTVEEEGTRLVVRRHALKEGEGIADPVRGSSGELRGVEEGIDTDNLLEERCHNS